MTQMKSCLAIVLVFSIAPTLAEAAKLQGYVMNVAAFQKVRSFCVDTHNLPTDQVNVINRFVDKESRGRGLLTRLPWYRRENCRDAGLDAIVRLEFPRDAPAFLHNDDIEGVLFVFRPGSPSPIYETPAVTVDGPADDPFRGKLVAAWLEYNAAAYAVRILIHDCQRRRGTLRESTE